MRSLLVAGGISVLVLALACSSEESRPACADHQPPAGFDPLTPAVSFSRDVVPIFDRSCVFSDCHNTISQNGLVIGDPLRIDARTAHANIVGKASVALPAMPYVTPGNPRESFLMHKLDGSQCTLDARCVQGNCGGPMPRNGDLLGEDERNVVRRWIAQGAKND